MKGIDRVSRGGGYQINGQLRFGRWFLIMKSINKICQIYGSWPDRKLQEISLRLAAIHRVFVIK